MFSHMFTGHLCSLESCLVNLFPHLLMECFVSYILFLSLHLLQILMLSHVKIFSYHVNSLFTLVIASFVVQKVFDFVESLDSIVIVSQGISAVQKVLTWASITKGFPG